MSTIPDLRSIHLGKNIRRIREWKGIKQDFLAQQLGISQQSVSNMEQSEIVDEERLRKLSEIFGLTVEDIKNFNEEAPFFHIEHMHDQSSANYQYHFNPIDKVVELYERMLRDKDEVIKQKDEIIELYKQRTVS